MQLRPSVKEDIPSILRIVKQAQDYLKSQGIDQWQNGYPNEQSFLNDIGHQESYVLTDNDQIVGTTAISFRPEKSYEIIYEGQWLSNGPCAVIHRICVDNSYKGKGTANYMIQAAEEQCRERGVSSIKVDTHRQNNSMQRLLAKNGFVRCGVIFTDEGSERIAFEKQL